MALFRITPQTSVLETGANVHAFDSGTPFADTLIVDQGAFLIATGGGAGAFLENAGAWNVTVNGAVSVLFLDFNNPATSTIRIGKTGSVETVFLVSDANFSNAGHVADLIDATPKSIVNSGSIDNGIIIGTANGTVLRNSGEIGAGLGGEGGG